MRPLLGQCESPASGLPDTNRYERMLSTCLRYRVLVSDSEGECCELILIRLRTGPSAFLAVCIPLRLPADTMRPSFYCAQFSDEERKGLRKSTVGTPANRGRAGI